jgi:hypothetical protein
MAKKRQNRGMIALPFPPERRPPGGDELVKFMLALETPISGSWWRIDKVT